MAEDGHVFLTCLQLVGTWVPNIFPNLVPVFLPCPQLVGTWVQSIFRNLVPDFWRVMLFLACHVLNVACHGVSISIVSISSVSCRVRILRVSVSMPCRGHPDATSQAVRKPGYASTIPKGQKSKISRFPDFQTPQAPNKLSIRLKSRSGPLPRHPGMKYFREGNPCC